MAVYAEWSAGLLEVMPAHCPRGHFVEQRPGWTGAAQHGHRNYTCSECYATTPDPACAKCGPVLLTLL